MSVEEVLSRLGSRNARARARAAREMGNEPTEARALAGVTAALSDASATVRAASLVVVGKMDAALARAVAIERLGDPAAEVRLVAVRAVGSIEPDERSRWALVERFGAEGDWRVRAEIVRALGRSGPAGEGVRAVLTRAVSDAASVVRCMALEALAQHRLAGAVEIASRAMGSADPRTRRSAAAALGRLGPSAVLALRTAMGDPDWKVRANAAGGLARLCASPVGERPAATAAPKARALDRVGVPVVAPAERSR